MSFQPDPDSLPLPGEIHENDWYNQDFGGFRVSEQPIFKKRHIRLVVVGAGAVGLQVAYKAPQELENFELVIYEKNDDLGGTWLENRYPGCTCDIPAHSYQFTWARNPNWSTFYAKSEEIWKHFKDTAKKHDLEKHIRYNHMVQSATWNEEGGIWDLKIKGPDGVFEDHCEILVNGSGILNEWKYPEIPGIETYKGKLMHSAKWDSSYDLNGKVVAVIGGGSSGIQIVPSIQPNVKKMVAFLRSPTWITTSFGAAYAGPNGSNFEYTEEQKRDFVKDPVAFDKYVRGLEGELNKRFTMMHRKSKDQSNSRKLVTKKMKDELAGNPDPQLQDHLIPSFALGCRRMTPGQGYLNALGKDNVRVVKQGVTRLTEDGVVDESGEEHKVDAVICATGFGHLFFPHFKCVGRGGIDLEKQFGEHPKAYLSIMTDNFPNLFLIIGPNGPGSHGSLLQIIEWHARYMFKVVNKFQRENIKSLEPKPEAMLDFYNYTHEMFKRLVWSSVCRAWFKNGKTHGPVTGVYPGSRLHYFELLKEPRYEDYAIQYRSANRFQFLGNGYTQTETSVDGNPVWYMDVLRDEDTIRQAALLESGEKAPSNGVPNH